VASKKKTTEKPRKIASNPKLSKFGLQLQAISERALKSGVPTITTRQIHQGIRSML